MGAKVNRGVGVQDPPPAYSLRFPKKIRVHCKPTPPGHRSPHSSWTPAPSVPLCCCCLVAQLCPTLCDPRDCSPPGSSVRGDSPVKNTGVGCHSLLQVIFPTQGSNPGLLEHRLVDSLPLSHLGIPIALHPLTESVK